MQLGSCNVSWSSLEFVGVLSKCSAHVSEGVQIQPKQHVLTTNLVASLAIAVRWKEQASLCLLPDQAWGRNLDIVLD